jgi:hypothetical protein
MADRLLLPPQIMGADGRPVSGAKLETYSTGTSTPKATYSDAALTIAHANPTVADAAGRFPAMFLGTGDYRVVLTDADGAVIATYDPVEGAAAVSDAGGGQFVSINDGPIGGLRNYIINGDFSVHQRNTASVTASGQYPMDRWLSVFTGGSMTASRQTLTAAQAATNTSDECSTYILMLDVVGGGGAADLAVGLQRVENVRRLAGKTVTVSFYARRTAGAGDLGVEMVQSFGTGGAPSTAVDTIGSTKCGLTGTYQKFSVTVAMPSVAGKTIGTDGNDNTSLFFWVSAGSSFSARSGGIGPQTAQIQIVDVQLEVGPVASKFERRPPSVELSMCQRFYWNTFPPGIPVGQNAGVNGAHVFGQAIAGAASAAYPATPFPVQMRATPTLIGFNPQAANAFARNIITGTDYGATALTATGPRGFTFAATGPGGGAVGQTSYLHVEASAEL